MSFPPEKNRISINVNIFVQNIKNLKFNLLLEKIYPEIVDLIVNDLTQSVKENIKLNLTLPWPDIEKVLVPVYENWCHISK